MVESLATCIVVHVRSSLIIHEFRSDHRQCNVDGLGRHNAHQSFLFVWRDSGHVVYGDHLIGEAVDFIPQIQMVNLGIKTSAIGDVMEGTFQRAATVAISFVPRPRTVQEILQRQRHESVRHNAVEPLDGPFRRKGRTVAATDALGVLILHRSDRAGMYAPVYI